MYGIYEIFFKLYFLHYKKSNALNAKRNSGHIDVESEKIFVMKCNIFNIQQF